MIRNLKTKQWNPLSFRLFSLASMISRSFQTVWRMREAWKWETYVRSQSFSSESAVKYLHVGRRKIQISPPLGEQDQSNALSQGQQRQSNPHPMPLPPRPAGIILIGALKFSFFNVCENMQHHGRSLRMLAVGFRYERKQWGIQGRDPGARPPPWSLDQTEARRAEESFLWDRLPPPTLFQGLDNICINESCSTFSPLLLRS